MNLNFYSTKDYEDICPCGVPKNKPNPNPISKPTTASFFLFRWKEYTCTVVDIWRGLGVYRSKDALNWQLQKNNLLEKPGKGPDDQVKGGHPDVVVSGERAYLFYFTHPGRRGPDANKDTYEQRRSSIQVVELKFKDGWLTCDRDGPTRILLHSGISVSVIK